MTYTPQTSPFQNQKTTPTAVPENGPQSYFQRQNNNSIFGMVVMMGMIGTAAGFAMYTRRTNTLLNQMNQITKNQAKRMPATKIGPPTKGEWDKIRPRFDKDEFI